MLATLGRLGLLGGTLASMLTVAQAQPRRLAVWDFDSPGASRTATARAGSAATVPEGVAVVPGYGGNGFRWGGRGNPRIEPSPDIDWGAVSVRFWYRPDWSSKGVGQGQGPGDVCRLLGVGDRERRSGDGWWELSIAPDGTALEFSCGSDTRDAYTTRSRPVTFQEGVWTEILLNVFPNQVSGFKDGAVFWDEHPRRPPAPSPAARRQGVAIGARWNGSQGARGTIDQVELFSLPLGRLAVHQRGRVIRARDTRDGGLRLEWRGHPGSTVDILRAEAGRTNWASLGRVTNDVAYTDAGVPAGRAHTYRLLVDGKPAEDLDITAGIRLPPVEDRGGVLVLVDRTLAEDLKAPLEQLERDLVADGWRVGIRPVARHDDDVWSRNTHAIQEIRALVQDQWRASGGTLRCLYLLGHVAIPYSGMMAEDLHQGRAGVKNHYGAWPSDHYYGDVDGRWTDQASPPATFGPTTFPITANAPGDGKFDSEWVPPNEAGSTRLEMAFGRVDFTGLPALARGRRGELAALTRYLDKVHRYRDGKMPVAQRGVAAGFFGNFTDMELLANAYRTTSRLIGFAEDELYEADLFALPASEAALWGFQSAPGDIDRVRTGQANVVTAAMLAEPRRQARVVFAMLMGSWFGDWALGENNILRAITASEDHGLAVVWQRWTPWRFDPMAHGHTLADAQLLTANEVQRYRNPNLGTTRTLTILGDPTLRMPPVLPPRAVRGERTGSGVRLSWQAPDDPAGVDGFIIHRSTGGWRGPYERVGYTPAGERRWTDASAPKETVYLVRAAALTATGSGSYTNLSQGVYWPAAD